MKNKTIIINPKIQRTVITISMICWLALIIGSFYYRYKNSTSEPLNATYSYVLLFTAFGIFALGKYLTSPRRIGLTFFFICLIIVFYLIFRIFY